MHENLVQLRDDALAGLAAAADADALEAWRVRYLGRKGGALTEAMTFWAACPGRSVRPTASLRTRSKRRWRPRLPRGRRR